MTDDARRAILEEVRNGTLSPEDAAARLEALDVDAAGPGPDGRTTGDDRAGEETVRQAAGGGGADDGGRGHGRGHHDDPRAWSDAPPPPHEGPVRRIRVVSAVRAVRVVGDPTVHHATATGPHTLQWEGDTMVVTAGTDACWDDVAFAYGRGWAGHGHHDDERHGPRGREEWRSTFGRRDQGRRGRRSDPLVIRMRPDLDLVFTVDAGSISVEGVTGAIQGRVSAGRAAIEGFEGPVDLAVAAGDLRARGRLTQGDSRIQCDVGRVTVDLLEGSSVRIDRHVSMGSVDVDTQVVGSGRAKLDVTVSLGSVRVRTPDGTSRVRS
jgi:hypothetical protein